MKIKENETAHEFLRALEPMYKECPYCGDRKSMVCLKCGYCYECHPAIEALERRDMTRMRLLAS